MITWSEYALSDGTFTGVTFSVASLEDLALNLRPGMGFFRGTFDSLSQRVGEEVPALTFDGVEIRLGEDPVSIVDWQPPQPPDDQLQTWSWDASTKRWLSVPTTAAIAMAARAMRGEKLGASDWTQVADSPLSPEQRAAWSVYRQALRDVPDQAGFPETVDWPTPPA